MKIIKNTIDYAKKYGAKLSFDQLWERLLSGKKISKMELRKHANLPANKTTIASLHKIKKAKTFVEMYLKKIKTIRMVAITGSVAAESAKKNDDIDLLIICSTDSLWLTRLLVWLLVRIKNIPHRRYGQIERKDEFCFNLWLEADCLALPVEKQNQKNAVDAVMMKTIYNPDGLNFKFYKKNRWIGYFCANGYKNKLKQTAINYHQTSLMVRFLNFFCLWPQQLLIRTKGNFKINKKQAFFHGI